MSFPFTFLHCNMTASQWITNLEEHLSHGGNCSPFLPYGIFRISVLLHFFRNPQNIAHSIFDGSLHPPWNIQIIFSTLKLFLGLLWKSSSFLGIEQLIKQLIVQPIMVELDNLSLRGVAYQAHLILSIYWRESLAFFRYRLQLLSL